MIRTCFIGSVVFAVILGGLLPAFAYLDEGAAPETILEVPNVFLRLPELDGPRHVLLVEKASQQLFIFENENGTYHELKKFPCSTGKNQGPKERSGDAKTPEGVYFFIKHHDEKELADIYGVGAFPTDYPNILDRMRGRTGNSIWLHGTNKILKPRDSNGCIAVRNDDFQIISRYIVLNHTPMIIQKTFSRKWKPIGNLAHIPEILKKWRRAMENGTYQDYLRFYHPDYLPDIAWWPELNKARKTLASPVSMRLGKLSMVRLESSCVVWFEQYIRFSGRELNAGIRKLFFSGKNGEMRIIGDEYLGTSGSREAKVDENPILAAVRTFQTPETLVWAKGEIRKLIQNWLEAWSGKDIDRYRDFYSKDFRSQGMNLDAWVAKKKYLSQKYDFIRISMEKLKVKKKNSGIVASFVQKYESSGLQALGVKKLVLKREEGRWKIYRETWRKI